MRLAQKVALNASTLVVGRLFAAGVGIVSIGLSTRYLGLESYGAFTIASAFVTVLTPLNDLGLSVIGTRELAKRPEERKQILASLFTLALVLSAVAAIGGVLAAHALYSGEGDALVRRGTDILMLTLLLGAIAVPLGAHFVAEQRAYVTALSSVAGSVLTLAVLVLTVVLDWGFTGVVVAYLATAGVNAIVLLALSSPEVRRSLSLRLDMAKQLLRWALPMGGVAVVSMLYFKIDVVLISFLAPTPEVALYGVAYKVVEVLIVMPGLMTITLLPEFARVQRHSERLRTLVQKAFAVIEVMVVPLLVLLVGFADEIATVLGGRAFEGAGPVLQVLMIGVALVYLNTVFVQALVALNQQSKLFVAVLVILAVNVALNFVLIPRYGAVGAATAFAVSEAFALGASLLIYRGIGALPRLHRAPQVLLSALAMAAVVALKLLPAFDDVAPLVLVVVGSFASIGVYVACLYGLRAVPEEIHETFVTPVWRRLGLGVRGS